MTEKELRPDYRALRRESPLGRYPSGAVITKHVLQFKPESKPEAMTQTAEKEGAIFSDEQLEAVAAFHAQLPELLSDPEQPGEIKSAYKALCDELEVPIEARDLLWEYTLRMEKK